MLMSRVVDVLMDRSRVIREGEGKRRLIFSRIFSVRRISGLILATLAQLTLNEQLTPETR